MYRLILTTSEPFRAKAYPVPLHLKPYFEAEVDKLLELGIIEKPESPYLSPVIMIKKSDSTYRLVVDRRLLNSLTVFNAEPMCSLEEDLHKLSGCNFFSELDIVKAYHQVMLSERSKKYTAFPTHRGLMQYRRMPFRCVTACATYISLMRVVLQDIPQVSFYFDNILVHTRDGISHIQILTTVLERL